MIDVIPISNYYDEIKYKLLSLFYQKKKKGPTFDQGLLEAFK